VPRSPISRAITAIKPVDSETKVFRVIMAKRGQRIGGDWENVSDRYFAHFKTTGGAYFWVEATGSQIAQATSSRNRFKTLDPEKVLKCIPILDPKRKSLIEADIQKQFSVGKDVARRSLDQLFDCGKIFEHPLPKSPEKPGPVPIGICQTSPSVSEDSSLVTADMILDLIPFDQWISENSIFERQHKKFRLSERRLKAILRELKAMGKLQGETRQQHDEKVKFYYRADPKAEPAHEEQFTDQSNSGLEPDSDQPSTEDSQPRQDNQEEPAREADVQPPAIPDSDLPEDHTK
jgi:hypothetical protein